jgi:hypothetical protein
LKNISRFSKLQTLWKSEAFCHKSNSAEAQLAEPAFFNMMMNYRLYIQPVAGALKNGLMQNTRLYNYPVMTFYNHTLFTTHKQKD